MAWDSDYIAGLDYVYSLRNTYQIASANMSLGGGSYTDSAQCDTDYRDAKALIDQLRSAGIATVIAAGNEGLNNAISGPGCITTAVSVGATTDTDEIASFSNRASWLDIYAPGVSINAAVPWTNAYATMQGTSMATPHVAGAFAVLQGKARQSGSAAAVDDLLALMRSTGKTVTDSVTGLALPRLRLDAAVSGSTPGSQYGATYQSAASLSLNAGTTTTVPVTVTNTGSLTWGANSVFRMSYHWYQGSTLVTWEGNRTLLPTAVGPGQSLTLNAQVKAPSTAGTYTLKWDLVQEGVTWFSSKGVTMGQLAVVVP
jgi:subtilisin family serine protease